MEGGGGAGGEKERISRRKSGLTVGGGEEIKRWRSSKFLCNSFPPESSETSLVPRAEKRRGEKSRVEIKVSLISIPDANGIISFAFR